MGCTHAIRPRGSTHMPWATAPCGRGGAAKGRARVITIPGTATNAEWRLEPWGHYGSDVSPSRAVQVWREVNLTIVRFGPKVLIRSARRARRRFVPSMRPG